MKYLNFFLWPAFCVGVGMTAGMLQSDSLRNWYPFLHKPPLTPPDWVFPLVWTVLYILMGISVALARRNARQGHGVLTGIFLVQLAVNFLWSIAFFYLRSPVTGWGVISVLFALLLLYAWKSWPLSRLGTYLFVPYIIWVGFAWYLNGYIVMHN